MVTVLLIILRKFQKFHKKNNSETNINEHDKERHIKKERKTYKERHISPEKRKKERHIKKRHISPEKRQEIIDCLKLK